MKAPSSSTGHAKADALVIKRMTAEGLPVLAAALQANVITGQAGDNTRFVTVREKDHSSFQRLVWLGLKDRDTIERVNKLTITSRETLVALVKDVKPGSELTLSILRDGKKRIYVIQVDPAVSAAPAPKDDALLVHEDEIAKIWANQDPWTLLATAAPEMVRDAEGQMAGVTSKAFGDIPLTRMLGLRNGDIVQSVNGYPINSEQAIFDLVKKLEGQRTFSARVVRNGHSLTLRYRVE